MPKPRSIERLVAPDRVERRTYVEFEGDALLIHMVKHLLEPEEEWAQLVAMDLPTAVSKLPVARDFLLGNRRLTEIRAWLVDRHGEGTLGADVFWFHFFQPALALIEDEERKSPERASRQRALLAQVAQSPPCSDGTYSPVRGLDSILQGHVVNTGLTPEFLALLTRREAVATAARRVEVPPKLLKWIVSAREQASGKAWRALRTFDDKVAEARQRLRAALGAQQATLEAAYLEAGHRAASGAALHPRHCVFRREFLPYGEAYINDAGVAVVLEGDKEGSTLRQASIFRPLVGRGIKDKARVAQQHGAFWSAGASATRDSAKAFLETFDNTERAATTFYEPSTWMETT